MTEPEKTDYRMIVQLTVEQLRQLIQEELAKSRPDPELLTPEELAAKLKVPVSWVYEQSRQDNIPVHRIGKYIRFDYCAVLESQKKEQATPCKAKDTIIRMVVSK